MKIKHKLGIVFILLLISIFVLVSNLRSDNEQIEIGVIAPLTGPTAWWGEYVKQGIELAYEELPLDERENIKLIWEDDQCSSQKGFGALRKLIMIDKVKYVLGPLCNEVSIPTENIFDENKVVSLTTGLPDSKIANMGEYHFSYLPEIKFLMEELAKYSYYTSNNRRIAIISTFHFIKKEFKTLPFCSRWIVKKLGTKAVLGINELEREKIILILLFILIFVIFFV